MSVELPKDAEGREIPLDTVVLFGGNSNAYNITGWIYVTDFDLSNSMAGQWRALTDKFTRLDPELMYLTRPTAGRSCLKTWARQVTRGITRLAPTSTETKTKMAVHRAPVARTAALELPCATLPTASAS